MLVLVAVGLVVAPVGVLAPSSVEAQTPPPGQPTGLSATAGVGEVRLRWSDPSDAAITGYEFSQRVTGSSSWGGWTAVSGSGAGTTSYTVTGLTAGTSYDFRIRASIGTVSGAASDTVMATPFSHAVSVSTLDLLDRETTLQRSGLFAVGVSPATAAVSLRFCVESSLATPSFWFLRGANQVTFDNNGCFDATARPNNPGVDINQFSFGVGGVNDVLDEPDEIVTLTVLEDPDNPLPAGVEVDSDADSASITIRDDDATVVSLTRSGSGAIAEGATAEFSVGLGRALVAGETIDVPLAVGGTSVTVADWSLALKTGQSINTGVSLSGETTATPKVSFSGADAQTATLVLSALVDDDTSVETFTVALGPDGTGVNGFDVATLATNVGGGADPHASDNSFDLTVNNPSAAAAPSGLTATAGDTQVVLGWDDPSNSDIAGYEFRQGTGDTTIVWDNWTAISNSDADTTSHTVTGLTNGTEYSFQVRAVWSGVAGTPSATVKATPVLPPPAAPAKPTGLSATAGNLQVTLSWSDPSNAAITAYQYRQRTTGSNSWGNWIPWSSSTASTTSGVVVGLTNGTGYDFQIRAVAGNVDGAVSDIVSATPVAPLAAPAKPTGVSATAGNLQVTLSWSDPSNSNITAYQFRQRTTGNNWGDWDPIPNSDADTTSHIVTGLTAGTAYDFQIRAVAGNTNGTVSDIVSATPVASVSQVWPVSVLVGAPPLSSHASAYECRLNEGKFEKREVEEAGNVRGTTIWRIVSRTIRYGFPGRYCSAKWEGTPAAFIENADNVRNVIGTQVITVPCGKTGTFRIRTLNWQFDGVANPNVWVVSTRGTSWHNTGPENSRLRSSVPYLDVDGTKTYLNGNVGLAIPIGSHAGERVHEVTFTTDRNTPVGNNPIEFSFQLVASQNANQVYDMLGGVRYHRQTQQWVYLELLAAYGPVVDVKMLNPSQACPQTQSAQDEQSQDEIVSETNSETNTSAYTVPAQLIADVWSYAAETTNGDAHVNRWKRVLVAFGETVPGFLGTAMSATEATQHAQTFWSVRWDPVAAALTALETAQEAQAQSQQQNPSQQSPSQQSTSTVEPQTETTETETTQTQTQPTPSYTVPAQLIADVQSYAAETTNGDAHVNRWKRVLVAFGETVPGFSGTAMSATEATRHAQTFWNIRWDPVVDALTALETQPTPDTSSDTSRDKTSDETSTDETSSENNPSPPPADPVPADPVPVDPVPADPVPADPVPVVDPVVSVTAGADITEGSDAVFTLTASPAPTAPLDVTVDVTASGDYGAKAGTHTVTVPTSGTATLTVATTDDSTDETDGSVTATITDGTDYNPDSSTANATINVTDNDNPPPPPPPPPAVNLPAFSVTDGTYTEGSGYYFFFITLNKTSNKPTQVTYTIKATGSGAGHATAGTDFVSTTRTIFFRPGLTRNIGLVTIKNDNLKEPNETLQIALSDPQGATISHNTATITIKDND